VTIATRCGLFMRQGYACARGLGSHEGVKTVFRGAEESSRLVATAADEFLALRDWSDSHVATAARTSGHLA
jgi:hypothetical protein